MCKNPLFGNSLSGNPFFGEIEVDVEFEVEFEGDVEVDFDVEVKFEVAVCCL